MFEARSPFAAGSPAWQFDARVCQRYMSACRHMHTQEFGLVSQLYCSYLVKLLPTLFTPHPQFAPSPPAPQAPIFEAAVHLPLPPTPLPTFYPSKFSLHPTPHPPPRRHPFTLSPFTPPPHPSPPAPQAPILEAAVHLPPPPTRL
jgi:hypothetical protein